MNSVTLSPLWSKPSTVLKATWSGVGNIDQFRWLSRHDVRQQLIMARDELGLKHVRAVAMYSPELCVWDYDLKEWQSPKEQKKKKANWQQIDLNIEILLEIGLKPIYTTCFTPVGMSDDPTTCWPDKNSTGSPRDLKEWSDFVSTGIRHHVARYGIEEVRSWYFECWNEPNLKGCFFGGTMEEFFQLWSATWRAVKSVDSQLRFGGPSTARGEWMPDFLDFTTKDGSPPDYLITHIYNNDSEGQPLSPFDGPASHKVKDSPHFATGVIRGLKKELERRQWKGEVHWNEWGRSWFPYDPVKESAVETAFIVKTMAEVSQDADFFAFWCLSDIYNQAGFQSAEFSANYGLLSLHGLRKQGWFAHMLLQRLGSQAVAVEGGDGLCGAIATIKDKKIQVLAYAYPKNVDDSPEKIKFCVKLPASAHSAELIRLGLEENNIISSWHSMGSPEYPTPDQLRDLKLKNKLQSANESLSLDSSKEFILATFTMERPGVAFVECSV